MEQLKAQITAGTASLQAANDELKKQIAEAEQKRLAQEQVLIQARKDLEAQQAQVKLLESGKTRQSKEVALAQKELAQLKADNADLEKRIKEATAKSSGMVAREELAKNEVKLRALQAENEQLKQTLQAQQAQVGSLVSRSELEAAQKALAEAKKTIAAQEKSQSALDSATKTMRLQTAELKKTDAARMQAEARVESLAKELAKAKADLTAQQSLAASNEAERRQQ